MWCRGGGAELLRCSGAVVRRCRDQRCRNAGQVEFHVEEIKLKVKVQVQEDHQDQDQDQV